MLLVNFTIPFTIFFTLEIVFIVRFLTRQERLNACRKPVSDSSDCLLTLKYCQINFCISYQEILKSAAKIVIFLKTIHFHQKNYK